MVLVFLKNLIFPPTKSRFSPSLKPQLTIPDLENGLLLSPVLKPESYLEPDHGSATSSISGDTIVDLPTTQSSHRFAVDPRIIADATIGLSDGLTVPFALTAGLSALGDTRVVIFGGLAEICAGAISMGIGGYLAAKSEADAYDTTVAATRRLVQASPAAAAALAISNLNPYLPIQSSPSAEAHYSFAEMLEAHLFKHPDLLTSFLLKFHYSLQSPSDVRSPYISALTIALSYFLGGFTPLVPYFFANSIGVAFWWSVLIMALALFAFGAIKTGILGEQDEAEMTDSVIQEYDKDVAAEWRPAQGMKASMTVSPRSSMAMKCMIGGLQMLILGGVAAAAAVGMVRLLE